MIKIYYEKTWERNEFLTRRSYILEDMEDICIQDFHFKCYMSGKKLNKWRYFLNPNTTVNDVRKDLGDFPHYD